MSAFSRDRREEERYRIICLRRRAKMEREVRGLCSRPGATIEQVVPHRAPPGELSRNECSLQSTLKF